MSEQNTNQEPTDFEIVTWAVDQGWRRSGVGVPAWVAPGGYRWRVPVTALKEMRRWYAEAHKPKPTLAEKILATFLKAHGPHSPDPKCWACLKAIQRVLDEEGVV